MTSFLDLIADHERADDLFLQHQEALMEMDMPRAHARLLAYQQALEAHMEAEEKLLLPVYERAGRIPGGPPEFFSGEHRRMREFLVRIYDMLHAMDPGRPDRRRVIALFDHEAAYKHLVEHHDLREKNILYPALDRVTHAEERAVMLQAFRARTGRASA